MPTLSIITAVGEGRHQHLEATFESLAAQDMPPGWDWQWIVQEDGESGASAAMLPADERISFSAARRSRAAVARTLALGRADGVLVRALDADDLLPAGALARDIDVFVTQPDIGWCVSPAVDLHADGTGDGGTARS